MKNFDILLGAIAMFILIGICAIQQHQLNDLNERLSNIERVEKSRWLGIKSNSTDLNDTLSNVENVNFYLFKRLDEARYKQEECR